MFGVRRDEDHVAGTQLGDSMGSVQLDLTLENDERLGLARVQVGGDVLVRLGDHLAEAPTVTGLAGGYEVPQRRVSAGRHVAVIRTDDSHPVEYTHGWSVRLQHSPSAVTVTAAVPAPRLWGMTGRRIARRCDSHAMRPELLLIALSVALGVATLFFVILNEQNSPRLARVHSWPAAVREALALALCAAVGFTVSIPLAFLGVTGFWAAVVALPLGFAYLYWRDVRDWWRSRSR